MRKLFLPLAGLCLIVGIAHAAEAVLDTDLMQSVEDANKSLASNIAMRDTAAATRDAQELHDLFQTVEKHYLAKPDSPDGLDLSRKSLQLTEQIKQQVGSKAFDAATDSATQLSRTCRACHTFYKQS